MSDEKNPYLLYPDHEMDRRPRYYDGQFLKADDFIDAQRYGIDRRRRHLRATTTPGVISGLDVTPAPDRVTVAAGAAVDALGRQIVLVTAEDLAISAEARGKNLTLYIAYAEEPSDEAEGSEGTAGFTRFHELPAIGYVIDGTAPPDHAITLAAMQVDGDGNVTADQRGRPRAGLRVPGATPLTVTTDDTDPGRGTLDGALTIRVPDGTAHTPARPALKVEGDSTVTGGLVVGWDDPTGYQGVTNDGNDLIVHGQLAAGGSSGAAIYKLGVGYAPPGQGEGTLTAQRLGVGRPSVTNGYALDVTGALKTSGPATIGGTLEVGHTAVIGAGLDVAGTVTLRGNTTLNARLDVHGHATTNGLRVDGTSEVYGDFGVTGHVSADGPILAKGREVDLGAGVAGRTADAGRIIYDGWGTDALCLVGAGSTVGNRKIQLYAEGGLASRGPADITGALSAGSIASDGALSAGGSLTVDVDATVKRDLNTVRNGMVQGRMVVGQDTPNGYGNVVADQNDLVVNGQLAAGGSGGAAMYSLALGTDAIGGKEGWLVVADRIGVNTTNPQRKLDVDGTARLTGNTEVGGTLTIGGNTSVGGTLTTTGHVAASSSMRVEGRLTVAEGSGNGIRFPDNAYGGGGDWAGLRYWRPESSGEATRLELGTGNDWNDTLVLKQQDADIVTLWRGRVGVLTSEPAFGLDVNTGATFRDWIRVDTHVDLGAKHSGREANAGKIAYNVFNSGDNRLELVGGGTANNNRQIKMWAEGGLHIVGNSVLINGQPATKSYSTPVRVVWGAVKSDGSKWTGDGFSCQRTNTGGIFQINFNPDFTGRPCVIATQHYPNDSDNSTGWGNTKDNAIVARCRNNYCYVVTGDGDGNRTWRSFEFIAIGPA